MHANESTNTPEPVFTKGRIKWAAVAAFIGCAACCALPLLAVAFAGTGAAAAITSFVRPGSELVVGGVVFAVALGLMAVRARAKQSKGCGTSCRVDGTCCDRGTAKRAA